MSESPISGGALDTILAEHRAKKAALEQEAAALREIARDAVEPIPGVLATATPTPGPQTSEGVRTKFQQIAGCFLTAIGGSIATYGAESGNALLATIGTILATAGAAMSGHAIQTYTKSRTELKKPGGAQ